MGNKEEEIRIEKTPGLKLPSKQHLVRTTFRISQQGNDAITSVSKMYGMKNADVFDMASSLVQELNKKGIDLSSVKDVSEKSMRKTYLIKKNTLSRLRKLADEIKTSRDLLIDKMVIILKTLLDKELTKKHTKYRNVLEKFINPFWEQAEKLEKQLKKELGEDDPIISRFGFIIVLIMNLSMAIEENINKGISIDPDDYSQNS